MADYSSIVYKSIDVKAAFLYQMIWAIIIGSI
ncbi:hypothetical protein Loa_00507 [Legionella oakridgensis ATCC 33761 = DSM 21215]|uniref:Uncharacterized protein n=1 Tax=Legionella oakridgensis ATCC 33761 = DSM 21215 TaxID=1268635 RepID=W0B6B6_9GAMM|nr:hypothetical protein Loa_00507 [Legionella oakridgensis ATCC 33761 = DSM 21215]ETO94144.1 hypothetical protein LOR_42c05750 [Legionella oakridgensis RV-2-2007]STY15997.1 Uncharacterised protein [Legionella longbeachae]